MKKPNYIVTTKGGKKLRGEFKDLDAATEAVKYKSDIVTKVVYKKD